MKNTTPPTSRRTASIITPATWRWFAGILRKVRWCWRRRPPPAPQGIALTREGPPRGRFVAPRLAEAVKIALERREQALLFLNRRGYAPLTLCRTCGFRFSCPNCDAWLVDHRFRRQLVCHHCGFFTPRPPSCPKCQACDSFAACGPGV